MHERHHQSRMVTAAVVIAGLLYTCDLLAVRTFVALIATRERAAISVLPLLSCGLSPAQAGASVWEHAAEAAAGAEGGRESWR